MSPRRKPFSLCSLAGKRGVFGSKLSFRDEGEKGGLGSRNPLFQEMGIWAPAWGRGISILNGKIRFRIFQSVPELLEVFP